MRIDEITTILLKIRKGAFAGINTKKLDAVIDFLPDWTIEKDKVTAPDGQTFNITSNTDIEKFFKWAFENTDMEQDVLDALGMEAIMKRMKDARSNYGYAKFQAEGVEWNLITPVYMLDGDDYRWGVKGSRNEEIKSFFLEDIF